MTRNRLYRSFVATPILTVALSSLLAPCGNAQSVSGTITGLVVDPSGLAIAGAHLTVSSDETGSARSVDTDDSGTFILGSLPSGASSSRVEAAGFNACQRTGLSLSTDERLSAGRIGMSIGIPTGTAGVAASNVHHASF